ncbi:hypothetical protein BZG35_09285 [Brevundimonas sp. LM2]|uniref:hypothetical protein n=1 Tax=Brevundimonas sp. LM2 TaxID=1938605 RepID=UPI0009839402|nr:hypothetical protein [Brevundimonas sp. LM2]AQR61826.1 hypothetical protein BZG35_09285 [Brevundimonas sp. LM2]
MTLFGTSLDGTQIASIVALLATLALWLIVLGRERGHARWLKWRDSQRRARHEAQQETQSPPQDRPRTGPWG